MRQTKHELAATLRAMADAVEECELADDAVLRVGVEVTVYGECDTDQVSQADTLTALLSMCDDVESFNCDDLHWIMGQLHGGRLVVFHDPLLLGQPEAVQ